MRRTLATLAAVAALGPLATACSKGKADGKPAPTPASPVDPTPVEAQRAQSTLLDVKAELRDDGFLLHVNGIPSGASLECDLDDKPLVPCNDGALFARPADGDHRIHAIAVKDGQKVAFGDSPTFTVAPGSGGALDQQNQARNPLNLAVADAAFKNGQTVSLAKDFVARFQLTNATPPPGCNVQLKCSYDSRTSPFWTACDQGANSFTVPKDLLASGLQYLSAQASCGDQLGPILTIFFYGVPADYQPLMLRSVQDANGRHILNLIKADDCPESQQVFECSEDANDPFAKCVNGNVVDAPGAAYRVRVVCDGRIGPPLSVQ